MQDDVSSTLKGCWQCMKNASGDTVARPLGTTMMGEYPNEVIHMDFFYIQRESYQLTIKDSLTNYCMLFWYQSPSATNAAHGLLQWFAAFGPCVWLTSDAGSHFVNSVMAKVQKVVNFKHHIHTPRIHWNAGAVENLQRHCKGLYKKLCSELQIDMGDCEVLMPAVQLALNSNETGRAPTGKETSPLQEMTRVPKRGALDAVVTGTTIETAEVQHISEEVWDTVRDRMTAVRAALAEYRPQKVTAEKKLARRQKRNRSANNSRGAVELPRPRKGDMVLIARPEQQIHKMEFRWTGPWVINEPLLTGMEVLSSRGNTYRVETPNGWTMSEPFDISSHVYKVSFLGQPENTMLAHAARMKPFCAAEVDVPVAFRDLAQHDHRQHVVNGIAGYDIQNGEVRLVVDWLGFEPADRSLMPIRWVKQCGSQVRLMLLEYLRKNKHKHTRLAEELDNMNEERRRERHRRRKQQSK